jgi:large subunit ribosomal protein L31
MKKDIHPIYYDKAKIICACGNTIVTGSTQPEIHIEICSACHPFFTGKQKLIDAARRIDKFQKRLEKQTELAKVKIGRKAKRTRQIKIKKQAQ